MDDYVATLPFGYKYSLQDFDGTSDSYRSQFHVNINNSDGELSSLSCQIKAAVLVEYHAVRCV